MMFQGSHLLPLAQRRTPAQHAARQAKQARRQARWTRRGTEPVIRWQTLFAAIPSRRHLPGFKAFLGKRRTRPARRVEG